MTGGGTGTGWLVTGRLVTGAGAGVAVVGATEAEAVAGTDPEAGGTGGDAVGIPRNSRSATPAASSPSAVTAAITISRRRPPAIMNRMVHCGPTGRGRSSA